MLLQAAREEMGKAINQAGAKSMSVRQTHFVIHGIKFDYKAFADILPKGSEDRWDRYEAVIDKYDVEDNKPGELIIVPDSMGSRYVMVGRLIAAGGEDGLEITRIATETPLRREEFMDELRGRFPEIADLYSKLRGEFEATLRGSMTESMRVVEEPKANAGIWVFTHFS